jgi:hypothetical protein
VTVSSRTCIRTLHHLTYHSDGIFTVLWVLISATLCRSAVLMLCGMMPFCSSGLGIFLLGARIVGRCHDVTNSNPLVTHVTVVKDMRYPYMTRRHTEVLHLMPLREHSSFIHLFTWWSPLLI